MGASIPKLRKITKEEEDKLFVAKAIARMKGNSTQFGVRMDSTFDGIDQYGRTFKIGDSISISQSGNVTALVITALIKEQSNAIQSSQTKEPS